MKPLVLIVEDEPPLVEVLRYNFQSAGFDTLTTMDGEEALIMVEEESPDLIVLDWMLPGLSGIEVCRMIRERRRNPGDADHHADGARRGR